MIRAALSTGGLLLLSGCFLFADSADRSRLPNDSVLADATPAARATLSTAHMTLLHAQGELSMSRSHQQHCLDVQAAAKPRRDDAHDRVKVAAKRLNESERTGSITGIDVARNGLRDAEAVGLVEDARGALFNSEVEHAARQTGLAEANVDVATARLDLARAEAANTLDRADVTKPDVGTFGAVVRRFEGRAETARIDLVAAEHDVAQNRAKLRERESEV
jgi:hypothetical protein